MSIERASITPKQASGSGHVTVALCQRLRDDRRRQFAACRLLRPGEFESTANLGRRRQELREPEAAQLFLNGVLLQPRVEVLKVHVIHRLILI